MSYLTIARFAGDPATLLGAYRRTAGAMDEVGRDHGLILHAGAPLRDGFLVVNVWPARAGSEAAAADPRRLAALRETQVSPVHQRKEHHELERLVLLNAPEPAARA